MIHAHDDHLSDNTEILKRLQQEVACLAVNLAAMTNRPEEKWAKIHPHHDDGAELIMSFSHEPIESHT